MRPPDWGPLPLIHSRMNKFDILKKKTQSKFVVEPGTDVWEAGDGIEPDLRRPGSRVSPGKLDKILHRAKKLYDEEIITYTRLISKKGAEAKILCSIIDSGTLMDRISAIGLRVKNAPLHNFELLKEELFLRLAKKKSRRVSLIATSAINELLCEILPNRKLIYFADRPLDSPEVSDKRLVIWYFENQLKVFFFEYLQLLESHMADPIPRIRHKSLLSAYTLLSSKAEQERNILALILGKFSDSDNKVSSKAVYLLRTLLANNPIMKLDVIKEVEFLMFKPSSSLKSCYIYLTFLIQMILSLSERNVEVSAHLINIYIKLLSEVQQRESTIIENKRSASSTPDLSVISRIYSITLTGIYRALPYANLGTEKCTAITDKIFTFIEARDFKVTSKALNLIFHIFTINSLDPPDKYYVLLYNMLLRKELNDSSKIADLGNLLYHTIRSDISDARVAAFVKRILQVCHSCVENIACVLMYVVFKLYNDKPELKVFISHPEETVDNYSSSSEKRDTLTNGYNRRELNPLKSNADRACLWEFCLLKDHFHPSVALYASQLLESNYNNPQFHTKFYDPLHCSSLMRFLDKITQKPPRTTKGSKLPFTVVIPTENKDSNTLFTRIMRNTAKSLAPQSLSLLDRVISLQNYKSIDEKTLDPVERSVYNFFKNADKYDLLPHMKRQKEEETSDPSDNSDVDVDEYEISSPSDHECSESEVSSGEDGVESLTQTDYPTQVTDVPASTIDDPPSFNDSPPDISNMHNENLNRRQDTKAGFPDGSIDLKDRKVSSPELESQSKLQYDNMSDLADYDSGKSADSCSEGSISHSGSELTLISSPAKRKLDSTLRHADKPLKRSVLRQMGKRAKDLGYKGGYFDADSNTHGNFAPMSDFEDIID